MPYPMSEAIACPLGKLQLKCWRNAAAYGGRGRRITSLSTSSSRPPPTKAVSQPPSRIHSRRIARRRPTPSARTVSVTGEPSSVIAWKMAYPVGGGMPMQPVEQGHVELGERVVMDDVFRDPA